jgi:hypothetical protein
MLREGLTFFAKRPKKPAPSRSFSNDSRYKFDADRFDHELNVHGSKYADFDAVNKSITPVRKKRILDICKNTRSFASADRHRAEPCFSSLGARIPAAVSAAHFLRVGSAHQKLTSRG